MITRSKNIILFILSLVPFGAYSKVVAVADSQMVMTIDDYYRIILTHHPVVRQSETFSADAKAQIRMTKGMLDPAVSVDYQGKTLVGAEYYQLWDNTLKIPTWFGTDFKVGFEQNTGPAVNGENATPNDGLWYAGVSIPLGQGLFIDERRNAILQARMLPELAEAEKITTINRILLKATNDYWDWYYAWKRFTLFDTAYVLASNRFEAVKARALMGEIPWIDTVEARIAVLDRSLLREQAHTDYLNSMLSASVHLWAENETPLELTEWVIPYLSSTQTKPFTGLQIDSIVAQATMNHPDLIRIGTQQQQLAIERRYQRDKLKPRIYLQYNLLAKQPGDFGSPISGGYYRNNYKLGFQFSYPLLLRKERGKLQRVEIKQMQIAAERIQKEREVTINIQTSHNNWITLQSQVQTQTSQVAYSRTLRDAEQTRFFTGESSFFLVNTREMALINSQIRLYELQARLKKTQASLFWASGTLIAQ